MKKYNIKELEEKLKRCKNIKVNGKLVKLVKLEFTDNGTNAEDAITNIIKSLYK